MSTYNGEKYLTEQLDSLITLAGKPDIYIRDDGSTDKTKDIIKSYQSCNDNIKLIESDNIGVTASFFELMKFVGFEKYDYFAFCDQDDFWEYKKVSHAIESIKAINGPAMYCSRLNVVDESLRFKFQSPYPGSGLSFSNALVENVVTGCTCILNKLAFKKIIEKLPDPKKIVMHDWWFYLVLINEGSIFFDNNSFIKYRQHGNNVEGMKRNFAKIFQKFKRGKESKYPHLATQLVEYKRLFGEQLTKDNSAKLGKFLQVLLSRNLLSFVYFMVKRIIYRQSFTDNVSLLYSFLTKRI